MVNERHTIRWGIPSQLVEQFRGVARLVWWDWEVRWPQQFTRRQRRRGVATALWCAEATHGWHVLQQWAAIVRREADVRSWEVLTVEPAVDGLRHALGVRAFVGWLNASRVDAVDVELGQALGVEPSFVGGRVSSCVGEARVGSAGLIQAPGRFALERVRCPQQPSGGAGTCAPVGSGALVHG
jgi:hypothetical protein